MNIEATALEGVLRINGFRHADTRGEFFKTFHAGMNRQYGIDFNLREEFFSISRRSVLRGMHFQVPPHDHTKIVTVLNGSVLDVVVDLRVGSPSFGKHVAFELSARYRTSIFIPTGFAHGFLSLEDETLLSYKTNREHVESHDAGIHWDSFGANWGEGDWILSERDTALPSLSDFDSPFHWKG